MKANPLGKTNIVKPRPPAVSATDLVYSLLRIHRRSRWRRAACACGCQFIHGACPTLVAILTTRSQN
jgi:hypothetical protein